MVRFAVIGTSYIAEEFVRLASTVDGFKLAAVYSRKKETAEGFALKFGGALLFDDLSKLAACREVDAVYIASPNICHKDQSLVMLRAGKNVLVEKPAAANAEDFCEMERAAEENGVIILEAMRAAFVKGTERIKASISKLGQVRRATISFCQYSSRYDSFKNGGNPNTFDPTLANGSLMDLGVYCVRAAMYLFGKPNAIKAAVTRFPNGFDAQGTVICEYGDMLAELRFSKVADGKLQNEIQGENGTMVIDDMFYPKNVRIIYRDGSEETVYTENATSWGGLDFEAAAFIDMIENKKSPDEYNRLTELTLSVMDEVRKQTAIDFQNPMKNQGPHIK